MIQSDAEISPDLEWMLENSQASDRALIDFIVEDQYHKVYSLCLTLLGDPTLARQASCTALAAAITKAHTYPGHPNAPAWLYRITLQTCRRGQIAPPTMSYLCILLQRVLGLSTEEISYVLAIPEPEVQAWLEKSNPTSIPAIDSSDDNRTLIATTYPTIPGSSQEELEQIKDKVQLHVTGFRRRRQLNLRAQEIALACLGIIFVILLGRAATTLIPSPTGSLFATQTALSAQAGDESPTSGSQDSGQLAQFGLGDPGFAQITPTPVTPAPPIEPLTLASEPEAIRQRILESHQHWHTLWADGIYFLYGPPGYVGTPKVTRQQVWISQPLYSLSLSGTPGGKVEQAILGFSGRAGMLNYLTGERSRYGRNLLVSYTLPIHELLLPTRMHTSFEGFWEVNRQESVAGRDTLVVDLFGFNPTSTEASGDIANVPLHSGRFWIDTRTGVILRRQWFDRNDPELITREVVITRIDFDVDLPNERFDPLQPLPSRLSRNASGDPLPKELIPLEVEWQPGPGRIPLPHLSPPLDFDPSESSLTFQWTSLAEFDPTLPTQADVFAGNLYLGSVAFGNPVRLSCDRSPDGQRIAFTEWQEGPPFGATSLRWFSLADLSTIHEPMTEMISGDFAFAPDSHRLALFGCMRSLKGCGVYLLDVPSGEHRRLLEMAFAGRITWSPDGETLAFLGALKPREEASLWVVGTRDGQVIYNGSLQAETGLPAADSPTHAWGVQFPPGGRSLENCTAAPNK